MSGPDYSHLLDPDFWVPVMRNATAESPTIIGHGLFHTLEIQGADWFVEAKEAGTIKAFTMPEHWIDPIAHDGTVENG